MLTGFGFESNQQLTDYTVYNNTGIFNVEQRPDTTSVQQPDSTQVQQPDSVAKASPRKKSPQ
jgi:hypothetical protein